MGKTFRKTDGFIQNNIKQHSYATCTGFSLLLGKILFFPPKGVSSSGFSLSWVEVEFSPYMGNSFREEN